jgi:hypothetical protein
MRFVMGRRCGVRVLGEREPDAVRVAEVRDAESRN